MSTALTLVDEQPAFTTQQLDLIKRQIAPGIDDGNLMLFGMVCQRTGLDPFLKQIYTIKRGDKWTIQTGIDGYRLLAARTGELAGIDDPTYDTEREAHPGKASVTVWRMIAGQRCPFTATARWSEYKPERNDSMWQRMPYLMLGKCAESLALRKAFPAELSGVYTAEEMAQADAVDVTPAPLQSQQRTSGAQDDELKAEIAALCHHLGLSTQEKASLWRKHNKRLLDIRNELVRRWNDAEAAAEDAAITFEVEENSLEQLEPARGGHH